MVILIQLAVFVIVFVLRRRRLLGKHLSDFNDSETRLMHVGRSKRRRIVSRSIGLKHENPLPFIVRPERWYDRWLKAVGLAREVQVKDKKLDAKWFFVTDYPRDLERLVRASEFQESLSNLFDKKIRSLHATSDRIWCVLSQDIDEDDSFYDTYYSDLEDISGKLSNTKPYHDPMGKRKHHQSFALVALGLHLTLLISCLVGVFAAVFDNQRIVDLHAWLGMSAGIAVPVIIVWGGILLSYFKGSSWIGWVLVDFVLSGILSFFLLSAVSVRQANIQMDATAAEVHGVPVVEKTCEIKCKRGGRRSSTSSYALRPEQCLASARSQTRKEYEENYSRCRSRSWFSYELSVLPWANENKAPFTFNANERMFDAVNKGDFMHVPVHAGYLGLEWVPVGDIKPLGKRY